MIRRCCLISLLLFTAWVVRGRLTSPGPAPDPGPLSRFTATIGEWHGEDVPLDAEIVMGTGVDDYLNRYYHSGNGVVGLYVGYYRSQREGDAVHSPMNCMPGAGWQPVKTERVGLSTGSGSAPKTIDQVVIEKSGDRQLVLYWYQTLDRVVASEYWSKAYLVTDAVRFGRTDVALVRLVAPFDFRDPQGEANAKMTALPFAARILPIIQKQLFQS